MKVSKLVVAAAVLATAAGTAQAQSTKYTAANPATQDKACDVTLTAGCTTAALNTTVGAFAQVNDILRLTVANTVVDLGSPSETDFGAGNKDAAGQTAVTLKSNRPASVSIQAGGASFAYDAGSTGLTRAAAKPAGDLLYGKVTASRTTALTASPVSFISSATGTAGTSENLFLRTLWSYATDVPGNYSIDIKFTVSAP